MLLDTVLSGIPYPIAPTFPACFSICKCQSAKAIVSLLGSPLSGLAFVTPFYILLYEERKMIYNVTM